MQSLEPPPFAADIPSLANDFFTPPACGKQNYASVRESSWDQDVELDVSNSSEVEVVCGACGAKFLHQVLVLSNDSAVFELDSRPHGLSEAWLRSLIQYCPSCHYCAYNAAEFDEKCRVLLSSTYYRHQLYGQGHAESNGEVNPALFTCASRIYQTCGNNVFAGRANLHAAWVYEARHLHNLALVRRGVAANFFLRALRQNKKGVLETDDFEVIVLDVLRRSRQFEEAKKILGEIDLEARGEDTQKLIEFERVLIMNGDDAPYLRDQAVGNSCLAGSGGQES